MNIFILAGEPSGDEYGAKLAIALQKETLCDVYSIGGENLKTVTKQVLTITHHHSLGVFSKWFNGGLKRSVLKHIRQVCTSQVIDRVIIIDFPQFNFEIARCIQSYNIPISTFITPNFWLTRSISPSIFSAK